MKARFVWILVLVFVIGALWLRRETFGLQLPTTCTCRPSCEEGTFCKVTDAAAYPQKCACV
jgi:hypothetical protein